MTQPTLPPTPPQKQKQQQSQQQQQPKKRRVRISEEPAQTLIFVEHLTPKEHAAMWYTQEEYQQMKDNRYKVLRAAKKKAGKHVMNNTCTCSCSNTCNDNTSTRTSTSKSEPADILCLRGLEQLLPNGKSRVQQKREAIAAIVKMYQQLKACCPEDEGAAEADDGAAKSQTQSQSQSREEVLKTFCLSKTRYAQHAANLMAVQDAACLLPLEETTTTTATTTAKNASCNSCCCGARSATPSFYYYYDYYFNKKRYPTNKYTTKQQTLSTTATTVVNGPFLVDRTTKTTAGRGTSRGVPMRAPTA